MVYNGTMPSTIKKKKEPRAEVKHKTHPKFAFTMHTAKGKIRNLFEIVLHHPRTPVSGLQDQPTRTCAYPMRDEGI
jgi:hypothetical protein